MNENTQDTSHVPEEEVKPEGGEVTEETTPTEGEESKEGEASPM